MAPLRVEEEPRYALLVSTALLRLLRAEVVRVRNEHEAAESRVRRVSSRADMASSEIAALEEEVSSLQAQDLANGDMIRSLRQRVTELEESLTDREEMIHEKEEMLTARHSCRSAPSTWCGQSTSRDCCESDDESDVDSACDLSRLELGAHKAAFQLQPGSTREALEERFVFFEARLAEATAANEILVQELCEVRLANTRFEERALVMEADRAMAMDAVFDADDAQCAAETVAANATAETAVVMARAAAAEAEVELLQARSIEADDEHKRSLQRISAERQELEEASQRGAIQCRVMLDNFEGAHRERAEQQRQQIVVLQERLASVTADFQKLDREREEVLSLQQSVATREAEWDQRAQDLEHKDRELGVRCEEAAELAADLLVAEAARDKAVQELQQQTQRCVSVLTERDLAWQMLERQEEQSLGSSTTVKEAAAQTNLLVVGEAATQTVATKVQATRTRREGEPLVCGLEADAASGPTIVEALLAQAVLSHQQSSRFTKAREVPPTGPKLAGTPRANPLLRPRGA